VTARRALLVTNPEARGDTSLAGPARDLVATAPGWEVEVTPTEMRGHGVLLAEEAAAAGVELVLAVGGDGTAREVAAGLSGTATAFGIVPAGTGNSSFKALFGDAAWPDVLAAALASPGPQRSVDLLRVDPTGELSLLGFSVGWFAQIIELAADEAGIAGSAKYAAAARQAVENPTRFSAHVELDGTTLVDGELGLVAIGGSPVRGSVFPVLPHSVLDDGRLDVIAVRAATAAEFGEILAQVHDGGHLENPLVSWGQGASVSVRSGSELPAEIDGDLWDRHLGETTISLVPAALRVIGRV
jgi:diacylglycerol kinase (ATP)